MAQKFYVVWMGRETGVFSEWAAAQRAVTGFAGACFKSFPTRAEAEQAFRKGASAGHPSGTVRSQGRSRPVLRRFDVSIYCDGACDPNPGHAGSGLAVYRAGNLAELWYGLYNSRGTNNTAELNALYHALRMAEAEIETGKTVEVLSDSAYSINCIRSWAPSWEKRGWKRADGEIKNLEIIQDCYAVYRRVKKELTLSHIAGHAGTEGNELADRMAMLGAQSKERELRLYRGTMNISTLLRMRGR